jgi:hypothetical protein
MCYFSRRRRKCLRNWGLLRLLRSCCRCDCVVKLGPATPQWLSPRYDDGRIRLHKVSPRVLKTAR